MFGREQEKLLKTLKELRENICYYHPKEICDCKYGYIKGKHGGEQNGCPELRVAIAILSMLSPDEYKFYCERAGLI